MRRCARHAPRDAPHPSEDPRMAAQSAGHVINDTNASRIRNGSESRQLLSERCDEGFLNGQVCHRMAQFQVLLSDRGLEFALLERGSPGGQRLE